MREAEFDLEKRRQEHWCWQPVRSVLPPTVENPGWILDPLDTFVLARLEQADLQPADPADRRTLIRRLSFDLTGLPPTPQEIADYLADESPEATEKVVDRLLDSPRFGEHWARHWLDLQRYAETCGHEFDYPIPNAWRYRDYVIRAFNEDVPYDQFVREHIAGDLLENPRRHPTEHFNESILGTGSWFLGEDVHGPVDVRGDLAGHFDNQIDVMGKTFLGLTISCARCHDHKFDAISTRDFYALAGYLKSSRRQDVMLDPGRRIESGIGRIEKSRRELEPAWQEIRRRLANPDEERLAKYLTAALDVLRHDPEWNQAGGQRYPGEKLKPAGKPNGIVEPQTIAARGDFAWDDNQQLWWREASIGDRLEIKIDPGVEQAGPYELWGNFTTASDYGRATLGWNNQILKEDFEFYAPSLGTTGRVKLGDVEVLEGENRFVVVITGHHENAIPRHMVGIDYLELVPGTDEPPVAPIDLAERAGADDLDPGILGKLVEALKQPELAHPGHPLHLVQVASRRAFGLDDASWQMAGAAEQANRELSQQFSKQTELFEDFDGGLPDDWFATGFAFSETPDRTLPSVAGPPDALSGTVHSGLRGRSAHGVIRSPTFVIGHDRIHFRLRGEKIRLRLIIEGYVLDVYNALLFNGLNIQRDKVSTFEWIEMSGDLKNHRGLRAHIEIIDEGDGWVEIDEIRFSSDARSGPREANPLTGAIAAAGERVHSVEGFSREVARLASQLLRGEEVRHQWSSWLISNGLAPIVADESEAVFAGSPIENRRLLAAALREFNEGMESLRALDRELPAPQYAMGLTDGTGEDEYVYIRGNHNNLGNRVPRRFLAALDPEAKSHPSDGSSGRLLLAEAIASPENPLTSRVIVNRLWHHLFGKGIVGSVDNFGVLGQQPTHPELLDYLAAELVSADWSLKQMIRRMVLSQTYRMSSRDAAATAVLARETDPENLLLHRANIKRITGESLRDSMLLISGRLDEKPFGPPVPIHLTPFMQGRGRPGKSGPLDGNGRRSIYIAVRRNFLSPMMLAFDTPIPFNAIGRRNRSNVPAQALILMNSPLVYELCGSWAQQLLERGTSFADRVQVAYESAFGQLPTGEDRELAKEFFAKQAERLGLDEESVLEDPAVWKDFCHVLFNVKNFIYVH